MGSKNSTATNVETFTEESDSDSDSEYISAPRTRREKEERAFDNLSIAERVQRRRRKK